MSKAPSRGRPSTLDHEQVVKTAVMQYWANDPLDVSINDICKLTGASKPGVYRAFGSDDGLKTKALEAYQDVAITPLLEIFQSGQSFDAIVDGVIAFMLQDRDALGLPKGCLFVMMRAQRQRLGPAASEKVEQLRTQFLTGVSAWVDDAKEQGQLAEALSTSIAAHYVDAQHAGAMRMQREGVPPGQIEAFLRYGFAALRSA